MLTAVLLLAALPVAAATPRAAQPRGAWGDFVSGILAWLEGLDTGSQIDPSGGR